ncbi:MAG: YdeI/OmpD-associated family protein [Pseudomonadota bacterium]
MAAEGYERVEVRSDDQLWAWLAAHHARQTGVWLVTYKKRPGAPFVGREAVLDALVAHGWVDGRRMALDDARTMQLITPRRVGTPWARSYRDRAARLSAAGRLHAAGAKAIAEAKAAGLWQTPEGEAVDDLTVPPDLAAALQSQRAAAVWDDLAPSYRRNVLRWIAAAKRADTRARRIGQAAAATAAGERVAQL